MRRLYSVILLSIFLLFSVADLYSVTALPDVSFIGKVGLNSFIDSQGDRTASFTFDSFEINATGNMHPNVRADFVVGAHNHDGNIRLEIEEAYVTFSNLPFSTGVKAGRKLLDFGRINHIHSHERLFLNTPLVYYNFLGEHALLGDGAAIDVLLSLPFFMNVQAGIWRVPWHEYEEHTQRFSPAGEIYNLRMWLSFETGEKSEVEIGLSGLKGHGSHHEDHMDKIELVSADVTYKMWISAYSRILFMAEAIYLKRQVPIGFFNSWGMYAYLGYRIDKQWEVSLKYDWAETPGPEKSKNSKISVIGSYYVTESLKLRSEYSYCPELEEHTGLLKIIFGIGPHSHPLQ